MAKEGKEKVRISRKHYKEKERGAYIVLLVTMAIIVVYTLTLVSVNVKMPEITGYAVLGDAGFSFSWDESHNATILDASAWDGNVQFYILYANNSGDFVGSGRGNDRRLAASNSSSIVLDGDLDRWFVLSWENGSSFRSFVLRWDNIDASDSSKNTTSIRTIATEGVFNSQINIGETKDLGEIQYKLNSANAQTKVVNISISSLSGNVYLDRIYNSSGDYFVFPQRNQLPARNVNITLRNYQGTAIGAVALSYDCSGKICSSQCNSNWAARNTSCGDDERMTTYYADANSCASATSSAPANRTFKCDYDGNGIIGDRNSVNREEVDLEIRIDDDEIDYSRNYTGSVAIVELKDDDKSVVEFEWNFSAPLDLNDIIIEKENSASSVGYVIINGLNATKNVYVDNIAGSSQVCIKDSEVDSISRVSSWCNKSDETLLDCPGESEDYICEISDSKFNVSGLMHSAVKEYIEPSTDTDINITDVICISSWDCTDYSECVDDERTRTCTDVNSCEDESGKPVEVEQCFESPAPSCIPNWKCAAWEPEICPEDKILTRTCADLNGCDDDSDMPEEAIECTYEGGSGLLILLIIIIVIAVLAVAGIILYMRLKGKSDSTGSPGVIVTKAPPSSPGNFQNFQNVPMAPSAPPVAPGFNSSQPPYHPYPSPMKPANPPFR